MYVHCLSQMSMMEDPTEDGDEESEDELNLKRYACIVYMYIVLLCHPLVPCLFANYYFQIEISTECLR